MNTRHEDDYNFLFKCKCTALKQTWAGWIDFILCAVILVGDTGVGKTHILSRYIRNALPKNKYPTIGVEFATKAVPLRAGGTVKA